VNTVVLGVVVTCTTLVLAVPLADPGVRFLQHHGFQLEQVYRVSTVELPVPEDVLAKYEEEAWAKAGDAYRVVTWHGGTPEEWRSDIATPSIRELEAHLTAQGNPAYGSRAWASGALDPKIG